MSVAVQRSRPSFFVLGAIVGAVCVPAMIAASSAVRGQDAGAANARSFAQPALRPSAFPADVVQAAAPAPSAPPAAAETAPAAKSPALKVEPSWPKTLPEAKAEANPPKVETYTEAEITAARAHCAAVLKGLDVVVIEEPPVKSGACGTPAPVQLVSIGKSPQVALSPPVSVTCDVVAAMHKWVTGDVQPLARKHLGATVIGIETMSSYSCRNAYGRKRTNLSEHGRANAIDIRSFHTADAREVAVLNEWGPTGWEIRLAAKAAAEKAAAEKIAAEKAAAAKAQQAAAAAAKTKAAPGAPAAVEASPTATGSIDIVGKLPGIAKALPGTGPAAEGSRGFGLVKPSHLGGPKTVPEAALPAAPAAPPVDAAAQSKRAQFLRAVHAAACRIFGTTLGPETNLAHKNHFHVDMAERARGNYCE